MMKVRAGLKVIPVTKIPVDDSLVKKYVGVFT